MVTQVAEVKLSFLSWVTPGGWVAVRKPPLGTSGLASEADRAYQGHRRTVTWLLLAGWCSVGRDPGKLGEQDQQVFPLPAPGPVHLVSPRLFWGDLGTGNELHHELPHRVALRGQHGLAWFIRPGATPPCYLIATPSAYPKSPPAPSAALFPGAITANGSTHSVHPFVRHSLICSCVHSVNKD